MRKLFWSTVLVLVAAAGLPLATAAAADAPDAPVITSVETKNRVAILTWDAVDGAVSYNVYRNTILLETIPTDEMPYDDINTAGLYTYAVTAVDDNDNESEQSEEVEADTTQNTSWVRPDSEQPEPEPIVDEDVGEEEATAEPNILEEEPAGVPELETESAPIEVEPAEEAVDGNSVDEAQSQEAEVDDKAIEFGAPKLLTIESREGIAIFTWNEVDGAAQYKVYRNDRHLETIPRGEMPYDDRNAPGHYRYSFTAIDANGNESGRSVEMVVDTTQYTYWDQNESTIATPLTENEPAIAPELAQTVEPAQSEEVETEQPEEVIDVPAAVVIEDAQTEESTEAAEDPEVLTIAEDDRSSDAPAVEESVRPDAPVLSVVGTTNQAELSWNAVDGATKYNIYRGDSYLLTTDKISNIDRTVPGTHEYYVTAINDAATSNEDRFSEKSNTVTVTVSSALAEIIEEEAPEQEQKQELEAAVEKSALENVTTRKIDPAATKSAPLLVVPTGAEGTIAVTTLRELRDADLPDWAKSDALVDLGHVKYIKNGAVEPPNVTLNAMSAAQLDAPLEQPYGFDLAAIEATQLALDADPNSSSHIQTRGICGSRWKDKNKGFTFTRREGEDIFALGTTKNFGNGLSATIDSDASMSGSLDFTGTLHYRERSNKCIGIPYRWEFSHADIDFVAELDGTLSNDTTLTLEQKIRLWETELDLIFFEKRIPIYEVLAVDIRGIVRLQLALDLEAQLKITHQTNINQDYTLDGHYETHLTCTDDGCEQREGTQNTWGMEFTPVNRASSNTQVTVDVTIRPSAELQLVLEIDAGVPYIYMERIFTGTAAIGVDLPVRLFWTRGDACSDANGDGINEQVSGSLIDAKIRVYAYVEGDLLGHKTREFITFVPNGWARKQLSGVIDDYSQPIPVAQKHLFTKVLSEGENSPLEPTINRAGIFQSRGGEVEGVELGGVRSCYPFPDLPTVRVDFGDNQQALYAVRGEALVIPHDWTDDGRNRTVRARVEFDSLGRNIKGPWVEVDIDGRSNTGVQLTDPVARIGSGTGGPELQWEDNGAADGFNVYRDGNYADTVRGTTSWSFANENGEHRYSVVAFTDDPKAFTGRSNEVPYGGESSNTNANVENTPQATSGNTNVGTVKPRAIVSMGDSFISGEAGRWNGNALSASKAGTDRGRQSYIGGSDQNNCHRSDVAEVESAQIPGLVPINLACSGAEAKHIINASRYGELPQAEQLRQKAETHDIELIVVSIGGNDLGFGDILSGCITDYVTSGDSCKDPLIYSKIAKQVDPQVRSSIEAIKQAMTDAGDNDYRIVLQSYPSPVPRSSETRYDSKSERIEGGCAFYDEDLDWARDTIVPLLDSRYRSIAAEMNIEFMSMRDALQGKEVCARNTSRASTGTPANQQLDQMEWVRLGNPAVAIGQGEPAEMFHPNALAQKAFGRCLANAYRSNATQHQCKR